MVMQAVAILITACRCTQEVIITYSSINGPPQCYFLPMWPHVYRVENAPDDLSIPSRTFRLDGRADGGRLTYREVIAE